MSRRFIITIWIAAVFAGIAVAEALAEGSDTRRMPLAYGDLDLTTSDGAAALLDRLDAAARAVCTPGPIILEVPDREVFRACVTATMDQAVAAIGAPKVAAIYHQWSSVAVAE